LVGNVTIVSPVCPPVSVRDISIIKNENMRSSLTSLSGTVIYAPQGDKSAVAMDTKTELPWRSLG
jgi:hypothetical protein